MNLTIVLSVKFLILTYKATIMYKYIQSLILLGFIFISTAAIAQSIDARSSTVKIEIGESDKKGMFEGINGVVGMVDDGFYVLRVRSQSALIGALNVGAPSELYIDKYNNDLRLDGSALIDGISLSPTARSRGSEYEFSVQDDQDNLYVYFSEFVKGVNSLYRIKYDPKTKTFGDEVTVYRDKEANKKLDRRGSFSYVESENRERFAIYSFVNERSKRYTEVYVGVFERNLDQIWEMKENIDGYSRGGGFSLSFQNSYNSVVGKNLSISLSNSGTLNIMRRIYDDSFVGTISGDYSHLIYSLAGPGTKPQSRFFDFEDSFILEAMIRHDQNSELNLVGYTGDNRNIIDGLVFLNLDAKSLETVTERNMKMTDQQKKDFLVSADADTRRKARGDKRTERRIEKGRNVRISARNELINAYVHKDNSTTVVSQYFDVKTNTFRDVNGTMQTTTTYIYGDFKYVNISNDGEVRWVKNIHKLQQGSNPTTLSVSDLFLDDKITYIYNDFEDYKLVMLSMDSEGNDRALDIADLGRRGALENHWFVPSSVNYISEFVIVGFAMRLLKTKLIKISL